MRTVATDKNGQKETKIQYLPWAEEAQQDPILKKVMESLDLTDRMVRHALKEFLNERKKALQEEIKAEDVLHKVEADSSKEAIIRCLQARINFNADQKRAKLSSERHEIARRQMILSIDEFEDLDPDVKWRLDIHRLLLLHPNEDEEEAPRKLFDFARAMGNGTASVALEDIREGEVPDELKPILKQIGGADEFLKDLADFLLENGEKGHRLVVDICENVKAATEVAQDEEMPNPLRLLAKMALMFARKQGN